MPRNKRQKIARDSTAAHAASQKIDRDSTAAYAASQPLFDSLRNGAITIDVQREHLSKAKDTVQRLHVKIDTEDALSHEQYMESIVEAWKSATDVYCDVFQQLTRITAAEPSEGREAGRAHEQFMSMLVTAKKARDVAQAYTPGSASAEAEPKAATVESDDEGGEDTVPVTKLKREKMTTTGALANSKAKRTFSELDAPVTVPVKATKLSRAERRKSWKSKPTPEANNDAEDEQVNGEAGEPAGFHAPMQSDKPAPVVEYEDVADVVAARLKAKAERAAEQKQKEKLKAEKKRKRESGDSFVAAPATTAQPDQEPNHTEAVKPKRKKAKKVESSSNGDAKTTTDAGNPQSNEIPVHAKDKSLGAKDKAEKRKPGVEDVEEGAKPSSKKRKKNKG